MQVCGIILDMASYLLSLPDLLLPGTCHLTASKRLVSTYGAHAFEIYNPQMFLW